MPTGNRSRISNLNICLTGFMGTGKTAVASELASITGRRVIDVDLEIVKTAGMSINDIFATMGEPRFREIETQEIRKASSQNRVIISTGGGAVLKGENMELLRARGVVVCLSAGAGVIFERIRHSTERPLLKVDDPLGRIKELLASREPYYKNCDLMINTEQKTPAEVAREILEEIA
ncbi:MAG: shikimate kinase [Nitrospiraceae bacterium]|nr:shikimate kinase [Nitrospiraceae bacterium]